MAAQQVSASQVHPGNIVAVIPALNEEESIGRVVAALRNQGIARILVVDNGSTDATASKAAAAGAEVVLEPRRGYGQACFSGCEQLPSDAEWILFCDADGCDDLASIPRLIEQANQGFDFVLGNRRATDAGRSSMTLVQDFGNWLATSLLRLLYGSRFHDLGPMRLIRRVTYKALAMQDRGFGWTVEMQARVAAMKLRWAEVPVPYHRRRSGRSKISGTLSGSFQAGAIILATVAKFAIEQWQRPLAVVAGLLVILGAFLMMPFGDLENPGSMAPFLASAGVIAAGFLLVWLLEVSKPRRAWLGWWWFLVVAVIARIALLPMTPGVDIWRYLWEGRILLHGFNPYSLPPEAIDLAHLRLDWWELVHHRAVTAGYPPLAEFIFALLASIGTLPIVFKSAFVAADLGVAWLLWRRFGSAAALYAWNPLILYSFAGGGHYDSLFLLPLVAGWLLLEPKIASSKQARFIGFLLLGLSISIKYVSAPIALFALCSTWRRNGLREALTACAAVAAPALISLAAFWMLFGVSKLAPSEFVVYARSAEFVPRIVGHFWPTTERANDLFLWPFAAFVLWRVTRLGSLRAFAEDTWFALYILSPVIHAWYFTWAIPFAVVSRNWGFQLISITSFIYYILEYRQAVSVSQWRQTSLEVALMWLPLVAGFLWSRTREIAASPKGDQRRAAWEAQAAD